MSSPSPESEDEEAKTPPPLENFYVDDSSGSSDENGDDSAKKVGKTDEGNGKKDEGGGKGADEEDSDASTVTPPGSPGILEDEGGLSEGDKGDGGKEKNGWSDSDASTVEPDVEVGVEGRLMEDIEDEEVEEEEERELTEEERRKAIEAITVVKLGETLDSDDDDGLGGVIDIGNDMPERPPFVRDADAVFLDDGADAIVVNGREVLPKHVSRFLSVYQREGIEFFFRLYMQGRGGILGDDMGLGKTVQAACFLGAVCGAYNDELDRLCKGPVLLISPASVMSMWKKELKKWTGMRLKEYKGSEWEITQAQVDNRKIDVVVASFDGVRRNNGEFFSRRVWDVIMVDEIHNAKSTKSKTWKFLYDDVNVKTMFGLSGTVFQNKLKELWAVVSLVVRGKSGWPELECFNHDYIKVIEAAGNKDAGEGIRKVAKKRMKDLQRLLSRHVMRRDKSLIESQLFGKDDQFVFVKIRKEGLQGTMYSKLLNSYDAKMLRDAKKLCECGSLETSANCCHTSPSTIEQLEDAPLWKLQHPDGNECERCPYCVILRFIHVSISISNHALLLKPDDDTVETPEKRAGRIALCEYYFDGLRKVDEPDYKDLADRACSCKLIAVLALARKFREQNHKTLIFFESLRMGKVLAQWAISNSFRYKQITGATPKNMRQAIVEEFNNDPTCPLFFISKRAGGTGLNIASANRVIIFEPCWNPTQDLQAQDRAYRLGQKRHVRTFRLIAKDTVEDYKFRTSTKKSQLAAKVLDRVEQEPRFNKDEVKNLAAMLAKTGIFYDPEKDGSNAIEYETMDAVMSDLNTLGRRAGDSLPGENESYKPDEPNEPNESDDQELSMPTSIIIGDPDADVTDLVPAETKSLVDEDEPEAFPIGETQDIEDELIEVGADAAVFNTTTRHERAGDVLVNKPIRKNGVLENISSTLDSDEFEESDGFSSERKRAFERASQGPRAKRRRKKTVAESDSDGGNDNVEEKPRKSTVKQEKPVVKQERPVVKQEKSKSSKPRNAFAARAKRRR